MVSCVIFFDIRSWISRSSVSSTFFEGRWLGGIEPILFLGIEECLVDFDPLEVVNVRSSKWHVEVAQADVEGFVKRIETVLVEMDLGLEDLEES